ncbi:ferritin subunit isoform X1 [Drosophila yakuba]|uniref:Ferritin n=2 Tax=Drosophila yakuba TaxID=7245 RepID=A0A0R1E7B7_DROYA|nr:ferritin subunit isoform X1 [Drosophila yakuba]XP_039231310.1 ferritin subunit isoform X1 [Drosophila yakuba]KRK04654.1 Fer1HCH, isoform B [Drosophila yakuba]
MVKLIASLLLLAVVAQAYGDFKSKQESKSFVRELQKERKAQQVKEKQNSNHGGQDQECKGSLAVPEITRDWVDMKDACIKGMRHQIQEEINASYQYLAMGAYFSRDTVNRPGFAEHFFKAAKEEREHGSKLVEYLSMRGQLTEGVSDLINVPTVAKQEWTDGASALSDALDLEIKVTKSIRKLIQTCESKPYNHYHLVDYLTGVYLEEQLHGQRELAGKLTTLKKMMDSNGELGEFLFDKTL